MPTFDYKFTVDASVTAVSNFHRDTSVLKTLTPPPIFAQIHHFDPLADGSIAEFTLWFGPVPVRWKAIHSNVSGKGFTDTQVDGPLKSWRHTHTFTAVSETITEIHEHIEYKYQDGWRGLVNRLFFSKPGLMGLFAARKMITRRQLAKMKTAVSVL